MRDELDTQLAGQYSIERELGRGGMAAVWLARDLRIDRPVALKILHPELAGAIGVDRFAREVRMMARLTHPNVLPVIESGVLTTSDGSRLPWYTMPYIAGESLRGRLSRERQLPIEFALRVTEQVADALRSAHQLGIVHRDIKPENVLLTDSAVYVADFGIAKALIDTGDERLTSTGLAIGTPAYMSPEQASASVVDARSDQYSLGCLLYEMLSGEPPFTGPTAQAVVARRLAEAARPIRTVRSTVPIPVERAVLRALERVPADRFDGVSDFAIALRAPDTPEPERPILRRVSVSAVALVLAASIIGGWLLWRPRAIVGGNSPQPEVVALYQRGLRGYARRTPDGAREAVAAFSAALERDSGYAAAWNGLAKAYLQAYGRQFILSGITGDAMLRSAVAAADRAITIDSGSSDAWVTRAMVSRAVDPTQMRGPIQWSRRAIALDSGNAQAWHTLASSLMDFGDFNRAIEAWRQSVRRRPSYSEGVAFLALAHYWHRQFDSATVWADSAVALDASYLLGRTAAGYVAVEQGDFAKATAAFEAARRVSTDVEVVNALAGRALVEALAGARARARATLQQADSMAAEYTPVNPLHSAVYLAQAYAAVGQADRAVAWLERYSPTDHLHFQLHLRCDPPFDPIRREPRFQALLRRPATQQGSGC